MCVIVLAVASVSMSAIKSYLGVYMIKLALPLTKSFDLIDENRLGPYKVVNKTKIENADILEELGTKDYIQWILEDTEAPKASASRYCSLFITYYTGTPDQVPHVPEECYFGSGSQWQSKESVNFEVNVPFAGDEAASSVPVGGTKK